MPSLSHWNRIEPFTPAKSEVLAWLSQQPDLLQWLWQRLTGRRLVTYDPLTQRWHGAGVAGGTPADGGEKRDALPCFQLNRRPLARPMARTLPSRP
jgi:hypothetical protein